MLVPFCEELITSCAETLPHLLGLFPRNGADFFPLILETDETVRGLLPLGTGLKCFSLSNYRHLLFHVLIHVVLELDIKVAFLAEEFIACSTETVINLLVFLLGSETDGLPFLLDVFYLLGKGVPLV